MMEELKIDELKKIEGGFEVGIGTLALVSFGIPFVIGFIDGLVTPISEK